MPSQSLDLLIQLKNETAAGFAAMQAQIKKTQDGIDALSNASKANVGASDAMAGGQKTARDALTATTASASQLASVLQGDLRVATQEAAFEAYNSGKALDSQIATLKESQSAWDLYQQKLRDVNQSVTALGSNLRANFRDALAQATSELLNYNTILPETAAQLNKAEAAVLRFEEAEKQAADSTVNAASRATDALMRETQAALNQAKTFELTAGRVLASVAAEEKGITTAMDSATAATLRQERALLRYGGELAGVRQGFAAAGVGATGWAAIIGGSAVYAAAKFEVEMQKLQGNTGASDAAMRGYTQTVLDLGAKGPAALNDIAQGLRHVSDLGYRGKDATTVLDEAWKGAIATGGKVNDVANSLATVLGNQHAPAAQAARDMDIIVTASQQGNLTLDQFSKNYARVGVVMSSIHQPLTDGAAAFATLSRAAGDPSIAQTWEANMLLHIIRPTGPAIKEIQLLQKATGVDLAAAFQQFAQGSISLEQVLGKTKEAVQSNVGATEALFGGVKGGLGAVALLNNHWKDYLKTQQTVDQSNQNVEVSFKKMMLTTEAQLLTLKNKLTEFGISIGKTLLPDVNSLAHLLGDAATGLKKLNDESGGAGAKALEFALGMAGMVKAIDLVTAAFRRQKEAAIAAWLASNPATVGIAVGAIGGYLLKKQEVGSENKIDSAMTKQEQQYLNSLALKWAEGKGSLKAYWAEYNLAVGEGIKNLQKFNLVQLEVLKADTKYTSKSEMLAALKLAPDSKDGKSPSFQPILDLQAAIAKATKDQTDAINQAYTDQHRLHYVTAEHEAALKGANARLLELQTELTNFTNTAKVDVASLNAPILAQARNLEAFGKALASSIPTIKSWEAAGLVAARDFKSLAAMQTGGEMVPITKSVSSTPIPYLQGNPAPALYANSRPYGGTPQYDPTILDHGTSKTAEAFSPEDRAAMATLSASIKELPPQFQGAFTSVTDHLKDVEAKNYNKYIDDLNKENRRHAAELTKEQQRHDEAVAKAQAKAQDDQTKENQRYLTQLDNQETKHNQDLANHLASFNIAFQSEMATFESNMVADTQRAESERQAHNDNLTRDYGQLQERLAAIHGKNAAQQRQSAWDLYNRTITTEDQNYTRQVTHDENHVKNQAQTFVAHVKGLKDVLDGANHQSDLTLKRQEKQGAAYHDTVINGIHTAQQTTVNQADITQYNSQRAEGSRHSQADAAAEERQDQREKAAAAAAKKANLPENLLATLTNKSQNGYNRALAESELYILKHGRTSEKAEIALAKAIEKQDKLTAAQQMALDKIWARPDLGIPGARFDKVGTASAGPPGIAATLGGFGATLPGVIAGGEALKNVFQRLVDAGMASAKSSDQQTHANYQIAKNLGDTATEFSILNTAFLAGKKSIDGLPVTIEGVVAAYNTNQIAVTEATRRQIDFDIRTGNTSDALTQLTTLYHENLATVDELTTAYKANADAVARTTEQDRIFFAATGQFGQLLSSITTELTQGVTDSQAKVTLDVYTGNTAAIKADTQSAIEHRDAQDALTKATWDATYITANAATQSQMRQSLASPMVSQQSTVQGLASGVFNAQLGVIAAQSAVQVSLMQAEVTATNDLAGIITAQAGVAKAQGDKQLSALNDSIPIANDNHAIMEDLKSGNQQQLQIDKEQLLIDRTTAAMDQAVANFQITIAQDQLHMAQDKMMVDQLNAEAAYQVAVDNLTLAQDNVTLAEATQKLGLDQLTVQTDISTTLGSVVDYLSMIDGDINNLQSAQDQIQTDQSQLADDTSNQNIISQSGQYTLASDQLGIASDTAGMQQAQQAYELQIAQYKVQLNAFQLQQKDSATSGQSVAALQAMLKVFQQMVVDMHSPAGKAVRAAGIGANTLATLQNSFATTQVPMGFS